MCECSMKDKLQSAYDAGMEKGEQITDAYLPSGMDRGKVDINGAVSVLIGLLVVGIFASALLPTILEQFVEMELPTDVGAGVQSLVDVLPVLIGLAVVVIILGIAMGALDDADLS